MTDHHESTIENQDDQPRVRLDGPQGSRRSPVLVVGHCRARGSKDVLAVAGDLARRLGAVVEVVHAISLDDYPVDPDADNWEAQAAQVLQAQRAEVEAALTGVVPGWSYHAAHGDPVELLATIGEEHDALMIVVGARGHGPSAALARLLKRSVSRRVIGLQRRPVLVVPIPPA
jgi:nucleotide-binding universal stress UspA family protein